MVQIHFIIQNNYLNHQIFICLHDLLLSGVGVQAALELQDEEDNDDLSSNLQHKIQTAFEERNKSIETSSQSRDEKSRASRSTRSNNLEDDSPASTLKNMSSRGQSSIDDDLMANFFENQEETKM